MITTPINGPELIYQDEDLLALNKPPLWIVNRAKTTLKKVTIQDWLEKNFYFETIKKKNLRAGIVHRLDKDTSGILLVAKTEEVLIKLQEQFFNRQVEKKYLALVHDILPEEGEINAPVSRLPWDREKFGVTLGGKKSQTSFCRKGVYQKGGEKYSLVLVFPKTGRTHQIRVHFRYLGYPIVADQAYVGRKRFKKDQAWCSRIFLHAAALSFIHPRRKERMELEVPLPKDLSSALETMKKI